jgi:transposase
MIIDLHRPGTTTRQVVEKFGVSLSSVKRRLRQHGIRRNPPSLATIGSPKLATGERAAGSADAGDMPS